MELSSQEAEIPMPINSVYGGVHAGHGHGHAQQGHMTHQHHHHNYHDQQQDPPSSSTTMTHNHNNFIPSSSATKISSTHHPNISNINNETSALNLEDQQEEDRSNCNPKSKSKSSTKLKKVIRYRECQKNHAATMGGNARDGCGEFMPSGEGGSLEALICSACNCHRNFHRKETEGDHHDHQKYQPPSSFYLPTPHPHPHPHNFLNTRGRKVILGSGGSGQGFLGYPVSRAVPINVPYQVGSTSVPSDQSDDHHHQLQHDYQLVKKRFRTKFSQEQKQRMLEFAEKVGWKIQRQEESVVQQFCQEVGIRRRVLKVWMHNNKHTLAKKNIKDSSFA